MIGVIVMMQVPDKSAPVSNHHAQKVITRVHTVSGRGERQAQKEKDHW
jgi:hypothetical protein